VIRSSIATLAATAALAAAQEPSTLQIKIVEGDRAVYAIGSRATRGVTVEISDDTGRAVEGATVSFRLPESGPGGTFSNGGRTEIATTRADGRVAVWGMQWNRTEGAFEVRITAAKGAARAGTICAMTLSPATRDSAASSKPRGSGGHKLAWILLGIAGAAGGGLAAGGLGKSSASGTATAPLHIGSPTGVGLGHP
jgi:hypothetical protein